MAKSNNMVLVLVVVLLAISVLGTVLIVSSMPFEGSPSSGQASTTTGKVSVTITPGPGSDSATGYVSLTILPSK
jgi:hypothetical protein